MENILSNAVSVLSAIWDMCVNLYDSLISWSFDLGGDTYSAFTVFTAGFLFVLIGILVTNWVVPN